MQGSLQRPRLQDNRYVVRHHCGSSPPALCVIAVLSSPWLGWCSHWLATVLVQPPGWTQCLLPTPTVLASSNISICVYQHAPLLSTVAAGFTTAWDISITPPFTAATTALQGLIPVGGGQAVNGQDAGSAGRAAVDTAAGRLGFWRACNTGLSGHMWPPGGLVVCSRFLYFGCVTEKDQGWPAAT